MPFDCECITHLCEKHGGPDVARGLIADYEAKLAKATNTQLWQEYCHQQDVYEARISELKVRLELAEAVANAYVKYDIFLDHAYDGGDEDDRAEASRIFHEELTPALIAYANQRKI